MWSKDRHQRILSMLSANKQVSANDLAGMLSVSRETVRRDLLDLEELGKVVRVHGGAVLPDTRTEDPFRDRISSQIRAKTEIAKKAVGLIQPGQTIMVDAGSTTAVFGRELAKIPGVSTITNALDIATTLQVADREVTLLGGRMAPEVPATVGELTLSEIRRFEVDLCFSAPVALHAEKGAFFYDIQEAEVSRAMAAQARQTVILAHHTKLGETSRVRACEIAEIHTVVTNDAASTQLLRAFEDIDVCVL